MSKLRKPPKTDKVRSARAFAGARGDKVDLFVYGALMNEHHVELLVNHKVKTVPAVLHHYMRIMPNGAFSLIVRQNGAKTYGKIIKDLSREDLRKLDSFEDEGRLYFRRTTVVRVGEGEEKRRQRCMTYIGNIPALEKQLGAKLEFEDRYRFFIEKKIDEIIGEMPNDRPDIARRVLRELLGSEVDGIIESHFDGNYICNYIMVHAFEDARPPSLSKILAENPDVIPYAGNYMRLACQHIVLNQFADMVTHEFPNAVRLSEQYFRHGLGILASFLYYNRKRELIDNLFAAAKLEEIIKGRGYRDSARVAIDIADQVYEKAVMEELIDYVASNWYSTPTPLGAELEFSFLGSRAVLAEPGEDKVYDGFYWFKDFHLFRRTWRLGGHVDSHRNITAGQHRHRGFFEYAFGRYQILGDLSRPIFDCPWGLSQLINAAVKFLDIPPHSLHISLELSGKHTNIAYKEHTEDDLVCLLLLGGDLCCDAHGFLREWRIYNNELDTNFLRSLHFSDRKYHFSKPGQNESEASAVMEYKYIRLNREYTDYETLVVALKGYQFHTHARPISILKAGEKEMPEQVFLRQWASRPQPLGDAAINNFVAKVEKGICEENGIASLDMKKQKIIARMEAQLRNQNKMVADNAS